MKNERENYTLFIDTFQNPEGKIDAVGCKICSSNTWYIYLPETQLSDNIIEHIYYLYSKMPRHEWLQACMSDPKNFSISNYYNSRYENLKYLSKGEFLEILLTNQFTIIDSGEQLPWFIKFISKATVNYSVRTLSVLELGDERLFKIPSTYSKSETNEIKQRLDSIMQKVYELKRKYGTQVRNTPEFEKFLFKLQQLE